MGWRERAQSAAAAQRAAERRRSHINDPVPEKWTFANMWVFGKHLPYDWGVIVFTILLMLSGALMVLSIGEVRLKNALDVKEQIEKAGCPFLGVILNEARQNKRSSIFKKGRTHYYAKKKF